MSNITTNNANENGVEILPTNTCGCNPGCETCDGGECKEAIFKEFKASDSRLLRYDIDSGEWVQNSTCQEENPILGEEFTFQVHKDDVPMEDNFFCPVYQTQNGGCSFNGFPIEEHWMSSDVYFDITIVAFRYSYLSTMSEWCRCEIDRYEIIDVDFAKDINGDYYKSPSKEDEKFLKSIREHYLL